MVYRVSLFFGGVSYTESVTQKGPIKTRYFLPPVSVIASNFAWWRGSLRFRFDFVGNMLQSCKVLIAYIPNVHENVNVTMDQATSSPHVIVDIKEQQQVIFDVPYIAPTPWWPRKYAGNYDNAQRDCPSRVYMFLFNPLIVTNSSVDYMYVNMYVAGGSDFEVCVPVQPSVALSINTNFVEHQPITPLPGYAPYYAGSTVHFFNNQYYVIRYQQTSITVDGLSHWPTPPPIAKGVKECYYYVCDESDGNRTGRYKDKNGTWHNVQYGVMTNFYEGWYYMVLCASESDAQYAALMIQRDGVKDSLKRYIVETPSSTADNTWSVDGITWSRKVYKYTRVSESVNIDSDSSSSSSVVVVDVHCDANGELQVVMPEGESDSVIAPILITGRSLQSTNYGYDYFGENFNDLMNLCRRYQLYGSVDLSQVNVSSANQCAFWMTLNPAGLGLDTSREVFNRMREGYIPLLLSGYRYYRGSMRVRLVFPQCRDTTIWVQHRPDRKCRPSGIFKCENILSGQGVINHGYAMEIQLANINSIVELELPFYQYGQYGLLQSPNDVGSLYDYQYGNGQLAVGIRACVDDIKNFKDKTCDVYYALADDFTPTCFFGFPPVIRLDELPQALPEGITSYFKTQTTEVIDSAKEEIKDTVKEGLKDMSENLRTSMTDIFSNSTSENKQVLLNILTNFMHASVSRTLENLVIAVSSVFVSVGLFAWDKIAKVCAVVRKFFSFYLPSEEAVQQSSETGGLNVNIESDNPEKSKAAASWVSMIFAACAALCGVTLGLPAKAKASWVAAFDCLGNVTRSCNFVHMFVEKSFWLLERIYNFIMCRVSPEFRACKMFETHTKVLKAWTNECLSISDPVNFEEMCTDKRYHDKVWSCYEFGRTIMSLIPEDVKSNAQFTQLYRLYDKVEKVRSRLHGLGVDSHVRKMPTVFYVVGQPGIGKTYLTNELCIHLMKAQKLPVSSRDLFCIINPTSKHWDSCRRQPVLIVDDLWCVREGANFDTMIANHFLIVTEQPLCPAKAELSDKNMMYNPEIVYINSNVKYTSFNNVDNNAINRRRTFLIDVIVADMNVNSEGYNPNCRHCTKNEKNFDQWTSEEVRVLSDKHHLRFRDNGGALLAEDESQCSPWMTWNEYLEYITPLYLEHREKCNATYMRRLKEIDDLVKDLREMHGDNMMDMFVENTADDISLCFMDQYRDLIREIKEEIDRVKDMNLRTCIEELGVKGGNLYKSMKDRMFSIELPKWLKRVSVPPVVTVEIEGCQDEVNAAQARRYEEARFRFQKIKAQGTRKFIPMIKDTLSESTRASLNVLCDEILINNRYFDQRFISKLRDNVYMDSELAIESLIDFIAHVEDDVVLKVVCLADFIPAIRERTVMPCKHLSVNPAELEFVYNRDMKEVEAILNDPTLDSSVNYSIACGDNCILMSKFGSACFYSTLMRENSYVRMCVNANQFDKVPKFYCGAFKPSFDFGVYWDKVVLFFQEIWKRSMNGVKSAFTKIYEWVTTYGPRILAILILLLPVITGVVATGACAVGVVQAVKRMNADPVYNVPPPGMWKSGVPQASTYSQNMPHARPNVFHGAYPQGVQQVDVVRKLIEKNAVQMCFQNLDNNKVTVFRCLMLRDRQMLCVRHYVEIYRAMKEKYPNHKTYLRYVNIKVHGDSDGVPLDWDTCPSHSLTYPDGSLSNICVFELPSQFPAAKNLVKFIASINELPMAGRDCTLYETGRRTHDVEAVRRGIYNGGTRINVVTSNVEGAATAPLVMQDSWQYGVHGFGMCGSILVCNNLQSPIVGIHVAGFTQGGIGISEVLCRESFESMPVKKKVYVERIAVPQLEDSIEANFHIEGDVVEIGRVPRGYEHFETGKTNCVKSMIHGVVPVRTAPNPLSVNDPRLPPNCDPLKLGVAKHGMLVKDFNYRLLNRAYEYLSERILMKCRPVRANVGVLDEQTAVCGDPQIHEFDALPWNTSAGYPLVKDKPAGSTGKKWLFDLDNNSDGSYVLRGYHPKLLALLNVEHRMRVSGVKPFTVFTDCLKDTTLPVEKCSVPGKTRIFSISPVQFTIEFRKYFGDFMAGFRRGRLDLMHGIGIDANSYEWTVLMNNIMRTGTNVCVGDYKNFGPGLNAEVARMACQIMCDWMRKFDENATEEDERVRQILCEELVCSVHLANDLLYYSLGGLPSGSPVTDILNSLVNQLYVCMFWLDLGYDLFEFEQNVSLYVYGDDLIAGVSDNFKDIFNSVTFGNWLSKFNIVFTDIDKSGVPVPYKSIFDCDFLKRRFVAHPTRPFVFMAELDDVSCESPLNWVSRKQAKVDAVATTLQNCQSSLDNAYSRGPYYYNNLKKKVQAALELKGIFQNFKTWEDYDVRVFDGMKV